MVALCRAMLSDVEDSADPHNVERQLQPTQSSERSEQTPPADCCTRCYAACAH